MTKTSNELFHEEQGIFVPEGASHHSNYDFDESTFDDMLKMQRGHFWYQGRHKLLLEVFNKEASRQFDPAQPLNAIDLGGGCGGWVEYLHNHAPSRFGELALGDGSMRALAMATPVVGNFANRYQIDMLDLPWTEQWDVVFLLDVLEHIPDHVEVLRQVRKTLRQGGLLFVATPALKFFWTYNDELAGHQRRYCKKDFKILGEQTNMELLRTDYFMFLLSPALLLARTFSQPGKSASPEAIKAHLARSHRIPPRPLNALLASIFSLESHIIDTVAFPWGTSILAVFKR